MHGIHEAACLCIHVGTPLMIFMCNLEYRSESISISISISIRINQNQSVYRSASITIDHIIQRYKEGSEITLRVESYTRSFGSLFGCLFFEVTYTTTTINRTHCVPSSFLTSQGTAGCVGDGTCS